MSIGAGSYGDLAIRQYKDMIEQDVQQGGSLLRGIVDIEQVLGERTYFPKIGASSSYQVTGRSQNVNVQDQVYERRFVTPTPLESVHRIEKIDVLRFARSPQPELVQSISMELGRQIDNTIILAISGTANRELNGVSSNVALPSTSKIANNSNSLAATTMSSSTSLHEGKLAQALKLMQAAYSLRPGEEFFIIGNANQLAGLRQRVLVSNSAGWFQKNMPDVSIPFFDRALDGFMGGRFVQYEGVGLAGGTDEAVYVLTRRAVKLAIYSEIDFRVDELPAVQGTPTQIKAGISLGAVRMWDEAVIQIACAATLAYA